VLVVRRVNIPGARYFGPYTDVATLRQTLKIIRRIFTVRSCHWDLPHDAPNRPCLDYHIHRCRAPCVGYQSEADYRRMIDDVLLFLEGKTVDVRTRLRERMQGASQRLDFERAAQLRDALKWLDQLEQPQAVELVGGPGQRLACSPTGNVRQARPARRTERPPSARQPEGRELRRRRAVGRSGVRPGARPRPGSAPPCVRVHRRFAQPGPRYSGVSGL